MDRSSEYADSTFQLLPMEKSPLFEKISKKRVQDIYSFFRIGGRNTGLIGMGII